MHYGLACNQVLGPAAAPATSISHGMPINRVAKDRALQCIPWFEILHAGCRTSLNRNVMHIATVADLSSQALCNIRRKHTKLLEVEAPDIKY